MPASSSDHLEQIEETLRISLTCTEDIDQQLLSASKRVLLHKIDFKPAEKPHTLQVETLRAKYVALNPSKSLNKRQPSGRENASANMSSGIDREEGLPVPKIVLYPPDKIKLEWKRIQKIGSGLVNMGNTCFLNSIMQCLTYTTPLANYCLTEEHAASCKQAGFCMMCELNRHIRRCHENTGNAIKPQSILQKIKLIAKHMHWGRQEDAHEFLRYVVDALQRACLNGYAKLDKFSKQTTVVNQIFGGYLRSQVQCLRCKELSNTYDPFLDLSLDIKNVPSLERAFEKFVHPETLDTDNAYLCPRCKQKVPAKKSFSIYQGSNVLTIHLKRFDYNRLMGKVSRHISFPEKLNLRPYMSAKQGEAIMYQLYGVLVHSGFNCNSGHYFCYVKSPSQTWYCMNDSMVQQVSATRVLNSEAYLLFYLKTSNAGINHIKTKASFIGPLQGNHRLIQNNFKKINGSLGGPSSEIGSPIGRKPVATTTKADLQNLENVSTYRNQRPTNLPTKREKVSFGIALTSGPKPDPLVPKKSIDGTGDATPRIVMKITHGKVHTTFKDIPATVKNASPGNKLSNGPVATVTSGVQEKSTSKLVPYGEDSDTDTESKPESSQPDCGTTALSNSKFSSEDTEKTKSNKIKNGDLFIKSPTKVIFDETLNATTSVPGNSKLLETCFVGILGKGTRKEAKTPNSQINVSVKLFNQDTFSNPSPKTPKGKAVDLSCVTSPTSLKCNSTSPWQVQYQDSAISPSVASSSTNSVNSTSDWLISEKNENHLHDKQPNRHKAPGWIVTESEMDSKFVPNKPVHAKDNASAKHKDTGGTIPSTYCTDIIDPVTEDIVAPNSSDTSINENKKILADSKPKSSSIINNQTVLISQDIDHKTNVNLEGQQHDCLCSGLNNEDTSVSKTSDKEMQAISVNEKNATGAKYDGNNIKQELFSDQISSNSVDKSIPKVEHCSLFIRPSEKDCHLSSDDLTYVTPTVSKKKHKNKKHKKEHGKLENDDQRKVELDNEAAETTSRKHKKKKKHKEKRKEDGVEKKRLKRKAHDHSEDRTIKQGSYERQTSSDSTERPTKHRSRHHDTPSDSDEELVWVEKTKDNMPSPKPVPVQAWDHHMKDGYTRNKPEATNGKSKSSWDGSRKSNVVADLEAMSSSHGFGNAVSSWGGGISHVDKDADRECDLERKREWSDDYEDEMDCGKVKKVRKSMSDTQFSSRNLFQVAQDDMNWEENMRCWHLVNRGQAKIYMKEKPLLSVPW